MNPPDFSLSTTDQLQAEVQDRFGVLPNFFRLASDTPEITKNLWGFAKFGYLDNPMPSLFKERLFVYLSRFCDVRYCIARHVGFLVGLGRPAGDPKCTPETVEQAIRLIRSPLARSDALLPHLVLLETGPLPLPALPASGTPAEQAIFACATHVFLQTPQAARCLNALQGALGVAAFQHLLVFLAFVRMAHFWTKAHSELRIEDDVQQLFETHEALAECVLNDPEALACEPTQVILEELHGLRREKALREEVERAQETDRRKTEFLAMLAHELRNPLAPIRNAVEILRLSGGDEEQRQLATGMIHRQVDQVVRLVDDLLDVSRISRGKIQLRREPIELTSVVHHAVETVRPLCELMDHELTVTLPDRPVYLNGDSARLAQVVGNLLNNACKFTEKSGRIHLTVVAAGQHALIQVQDTGIGLASEQLTGIFEMFKQVDTSIERSRDGLGLGLALVKSLVEMHGGTAEARSPGIGQGSEFVVRLPILADVAQPSPKPVPGAPPASIKARRILVVDDNRDSAESLAMLLKLTGHETHTAHDGIAALEAAATHRPDVVLLDIGLPRLNGYDTARGIREQPWGKGMLLIALTGWGQEEDRQRSRDAGFNEHMVKPIDYDALMRLMAETPPARSTASAG